MSLAHVEFTRIVLGLDQRALDRAALRFAADFAKLLQLDLVGLFAEDPSLAQLAEIGGSAVGAGVGVGTVGTEGPVGGFAGLSPPPPQTLSAIEASTTAASPTIPLDDRLMATLPSAAQARPGNTAL